MRALCAGGSFACGTASSRAQLFELHSWLHRWASLLLQSAPVLGPAFSKSRFPSPLAQAARPAVLFAARHQRWWKCDTHVRLRCLIASPRLLLRTVALCICYYQLFSAHGPHPREKEDFLHFSRMRLPVLLKVGEWRSNTRTTSISLT